MAEASSQNYTAVSWNIEGFKRNKCNLKYFTDIFKPNLIFVSEPNLYQCDLSLATQIFKGEYCSFLNSSDLHDQSLPLSRSIAQGGTMIMWKVEHDPYITIIPVTCPSFQPILFKPPGHLQSIHIAVYLPTQGQ